MIYFDNAATTFPKPSTVSKAVKQGVDIYGGNPGRSGHKLSILSGQKVYECRKTVADFFGASVDGTIFTTNCTHALNLAIKGLLQDGDHVVISELDHNAVVRPIHALSQTGTISYDVATVDLYNDNNTVASFESCIKPNTKAIVCTHASNVLGTVLPIKRIGELCSARGIHFILDAAQTAGVLPIDLTENHISILCTAGHKGLLGPTGTGVLCMAKELPLATLIEGGTGSASLSLDQPDFYPDRLESGTVNTVGICGLHEGIRYLQKHGLTDLYDHEFGLCWQVFQWLSHHLDYQVYLPLYQYTKTAPIVLFNHHRLHSVDLVNRLDELGYCLRGGLHCAPLAHQKIGTLQTGAVRFSPGIFTKLQDITSFLADLSSIV